MDFFSSILKVLAEQSESVEVGIEKEHLRGTFSIMDMNIETAYDQLNELKAKFMNFRKELGGLDIDEFEAALTPLVYKGISRTQIRKCFEKMDPTDQGMLNWNDFINFAIEEHSKRIQMRETYDEMPFGPLGIPIKHNHQEVFVRITFMPNVDPVTKIVEWSQGKYMMISRDSILSVWNNRFQNQGYFNIGTKGRVKVSWIMDMVCMYHNGMVVCATTNRDICFYNFNTEGWSKKYAILRMEGSVTRLSYWSDETKDMKAVLLWGDTTGSVIMLEFDLSQRLPLFGKRLRPYCIEMMYADIQKGHYEGVTYRAYLNVHKDWVREVMYVPKMTSILSCSTDASTALYLTPVDPTKKQPRYFATYKGVLCFDFSAGTNTIAAAGMDCNIWLFNIYVPQKCVAMLEGHNRPVSHIKINEKENFVISLDLDNNLRISNLITQRVIMKIPSQGLKCGLYGINTMCLNPVKNVCLLGSARLTMLKPNQIEGLTVDIRSHDHPLVGALYNPFFQQVISICRGSMIRIWDINTGTRVMQFAMAHSKKIHGRVVPVEIECASLTDNKKRLFTSAEGVVKLWNFSCGALLRVFDLKDCERIESIVMAKSLIYITGWNKVITVFSDFKGEEALRKVWQKRHNEDVLSLCVLEPNMIASSSYDGSIVIWSRETQEPYCKLSASFSNKPELIGTKGGTIISAVANLDAESDDEEDQGEDAFMTIGRHLRKEGGWYRLLRALKKRQIERQRRRAARERKDISAKFKRKKKRMNMQGLSLVYESAVECLVYLESRHAIEPHTATLVAGGAECWIRFWSLHPNGGLLAQWNCTRRKLESIRAMTTDKENEYLFTGDTTGLLRIWDIKEFANSEKLSPEAREARETRLKKEFCYLRLPFKQEEILDTMEKLRAMRISVPDASKPRKNLKSPRLLSSIRAHTQAIMSVEFIEERAIILTSSLDMTVRVWTKNCTYIGTFGSNGWRPLPTVVGPIVEKKPKIPKDVLRVASARSLATMHNAKMPHWSNACHLVKRHIIELQREKNIEATRQKMKEEKRARGEPDSEEEAADEEKPESKILGKNYHSKLRCKGNKNMKEYGYPPLLIFRTTCSPYHSVHPRDVGHMEPLYPVSVLQDIDSRRSKRSKRTLKHMMNQFRLISGEGHGDASKASPSVISTTTVQSSFFDRGKTSSFSPKNVSSNKSASPDSTVFDRNQSSPLSPPSLRPENSSSSTQRQVNRRTRYSDVKPTKRSLTLSPRRHGKSTPRSVTWESHIHDWNQGSSPSRSSIGSFSPSENYEEDAVVAYELPSPSDASGSQTSNEHNTGFSHQRPKFFQKTYQPQQTYGNRKSSTISHTTIDENLQMWEEKYTALKERFVEEERERRSGVFKSPAVTKSLGVRNSESSNMKGPFNKSAGSVGSSVKTPFNKKSVSSVSSSMRTPFNESANSQISRFSACSGHKNRVSIEDDDKASFSRPRFYSETEEMLAAARECIKADIKFNLQDSQYLDGDVGSDDFKLEGENSESFDRRTYYRPQNNSNCNPKIHKPNTRSRSGLRLPTIRCDKRKEGDHHKSVGPKFRYPHLI